MNNEQTPITVQTTVNAPVKKVWELWNEPKHITKWNSASDEWHTPRAENDLREGGTFTARMEAKDGRAGFDFSGVYTKVRDNEHIAYEMGDGRFHPGRRQDEGRRDIRSGIRKSS
jgi:uncharacterized protein YndB with AHSA1/START domain